MFVTPMAGVPSALGIAEGSTSFGAIWRVCRILLEIMSAIIARRHAEVSSLLCLFAAACNFEEASIDFHMRALPKRAAWMNSCLTLPLGVLMMQNCLDRKRRNGSNLSPARRCARALCTVSECVLRSVSFEILDASLNGGVRGLPLPMRH